MRSTASVLAELGDALHAAAADSAVTLRRDLRGAGLMFSSGMDLGALADAGREARAPARVPQASSSHVWNLAEEMAKPTICVIHGACIGGAIELALACDLRVMAKDAVVGLPETRIGLIPDVGGSSRLPPGRRPRPRQGADHDRAR